MALNIQQKKPTPKHKQPVGNDYSQHLGGPATTGKIGSGNLEIIKKNNKTKEEQLLATEEYMVGKPSMIPADQLAHVSVGASQTINIGNFESVKVSVHLTLPAHIHTVDETFEHCTSWVSEKMEKSVNEIKG